MVFYLFALLAVAVLVIIFMSKEPLIVNNHRTIRFHYVDWCAYCKIMKPVWERVKKNAHNDFIIFEEINEDVAKTAGIYKYPTILKVTERGKLVEYNGTANYADLYNFVTIIN